jgi:hypothetical protein
MDNTSIATLPAISGSFPQLPEPLIPRPQYIEAFDTALDGPVSIVVVEGEEGAGKTVLAAQYALSKPDRTFSLFVSGLSAFSRSPEFLLSDLCDQIHWLFHGVRMSEGDNPELFLRQSKLRLQRLAARSKIPFVFVVDGLLEVADAAPGLVSLVLTEYLPLGVSGFKFLLTGDSERIPEAIRDKVVFKPFPIIGFTSDETKTYLSECRLDPAALTEIYRTFKLPGKLASIRRILAGGSRLDPSAIPTTFVELFGVEWRAVSEGNETLVEALALLGHSRHELTIDDLSRLLRTPTADITALFVAIRFVTIDERTGIVNFVSTSFKRFVQTKLERRRDEAITRIISDLYSRKLSPVALEQLPQYLEIAGRPTEIIEYLTPDYLSRVSGQTQSLAPVDLAIESGIRAARRLRLPTDMARFILQRATVRDLGRETALGSEVDANLSLGQEGVAYALAQRAALKEHRLTLLAKVARHQHKIRKPIAPEVLEEIQRLVEATDFRAIPTKAVEIASDLVFIEPELAMRLVESAIGSSQDYPLDVALAHLSISASDEARDDGGARLSSDAISEKIANPDVRGLVRGVSSLVGKYAEDELISRCEQINGTRECISLLERWSVTNTQNASAWKVTDYAIERILKTTEYIANAGTFRRLASPLPYVANVHPDKANRALQRIIAQLLVLQKRGPAVEYVRLELLVAETEATWDSRQALDRIEQLVYGCGTLDVANRSEALARVLRMLSENAGRLPSEAIDLTALVETELVGAVDAVLAASAEHGEVMRGVVRALLPARNKLARAIINKVNIRERRDALRREAMAQLVQPSIKVVDFGLLQEFLSAIEQASFRDDVQYFILQKVEARGDKGSVGSKPLIASSLGTAKSPLKALACSVAYSLCFGSGCTELEDLLPVLKREMEAALERVNSGWDQVDIGFAVATRLADTDPALASIFMAKAEEARRRTPLAEQGSAEAYIRVVRLAIRAFAGIVAQQIDVEGSLAELERLIARVPSEGERARLWSAVAERCFSAGAVELANRVSDTRLIPLLDAISDEGFQAFVVADVSPALFRRHAATALQRISRLEDGSRNRAVANVCRFVLARLPATEPLDRRGQPYEVDYAGALDIVNCLRHCDHDATFAFIVVDLCVALTSEAGTQKVSKGQRADIERSLNELCDIKLPSPTGVQHEGYRIVVHAALGLLRQTNESYWRALLSDALAVPNVADEVFILAVLAEAIPAKFDAVRIEALSRGLALAEGIAAPIDRIDRLQLLSRAAAEFDMRTAKEALEKAFRLSTSQSSDMKRSQERMIDFAYGLDPDFAESLAGYLEDDPAHVRSRLAINDVRRSLRGTISDADLEKLGDRGLGDFGWSMLGSLNAGRVSHMHAEAMLPAIERAGSGMSSAFPVLSWFIQNSIVRYAGTGYGTTHLVDLFDSIVHACELTYHVTLNIAGRRPETGTVSITGDAFSSSEVIPPGDRRKAIERVSKWLQDVSPTYLKVRDPYFTPDDLFLLKLIRDANPKCYVQMLIGEKKHKDERVLQPYDEAYRQRWRTVSAQDPPETTIVIAGLVPTGDCPVHERWIVGDGKGLRLGTSFSGLGGKRDSDITELAEPAAREREATLSFYLGLPPRTGG